MDLNSLEKCFNNAYEQGSKYIAVKVQMQGV